MRLCIGLPAQKTGICDNEVESLLCMNEFDGNGFQSVVGQTLRFQNHPAELCMPDQPFTTNGVIYYTVAFLSRHTNNKKTL